MDLNRIKKLTVFLVIIVDNFLGGAENFPKTRNTQFNELL